MKTIINAVKQVNFKYTFPNDLSEICFFDIETTGLSPAASSLYMIGFMYYDETIENFKICQWFADNYHSEAMIINEFLGQLENYKYLYHFNGRTFDIPYILNKCKKHGIVLTPHTDAILSDTTGQFSIDILAGIRPLKKLLGLSKANQTSLERWLGINREDKYDGGKLIAVYSEYMQKKIMAQDEASELERLLLLHNHDDMQGMLSVSSMLLYGDFFDKAYESQFQVTDIFFDESDDLAIKFSHSYNFPKPVQISKNFPKSKICDYELVLSLYLDKNTGILKIPALQGVLKLFFDNYKDYYYIPEEDCAILKILGSSYDKSRRKNATASTCYIKKEGMYLPSLTLRKPDTEIPVFYLTYRDKLCFYELPPTPFNSNDVFWNSYLRLQLSAIK